MRLPVERCRRGSPLTAFAILGALALGACATTAKPGAFTAAASAGGPQGDYPVVTGAPYAIEGQNFTPEDVLNYDNVGMAAADDAQSGGITAAHHTLPLPSYVEVTSLITGRTILVRVERRGPMTGTQLIALSPAALRQLGASEGTPVRVRRVNPPEEQRALLRAGQPAPLRIDTPMSLVEVLKRKLPGSPAVASVKAPTDIPPAPAAAQSVSSSTPATPDYKKEARRASPATGAKSAAAVQHAQATVAKTEVTPTAKTKPAANEVASSVAPDTHGFFVQAASFASSTNAKKAARTLGGAVTTFGKLYRVQTGPFATRALAQASLAKVRSAGYTDARIQTGG